MEMRRSDSSGTDDDLPPSLMPRAGNSRTLTSANGKTGAANGTKKLDQLVRVLEQDAYKAVLRAFGAQAEVITWARERLISTLRDELRVSDELHRELLTTVAGEESLREIRDLRQQCGGDQPIPASNDVMTTSAQHSSPLVPQSRKKRKTGAVSHQVTATSPAAAAPPPPPPPPAPSSAPGPAKSASKKGGAAAAPRGKSKGSSDKISAQRRGPSHEKRSDFGPEDRWVGQFIKMRWPDDNNFYEAFVRDFHKEDGTHTVVYDMGTEKETSERVDLSKMAPEDIQSNGKHHPGKKSSSADKHHGSKKRGEKAPSSQQHKRKGGDKLHSMDSLMKQVQDLEHDADPSKIEYVKRLAKEHEESLRRALKEMGDSSGEDEDGTDDDRQKKNTSLAVNRDERRINGDG